MKFLGLVFALLSAAPLWAQNHLLGENSPYLQQHLYNEVDWYPWGEEALEKARVEGKPIFLSIGYSSCHWCHVMEEESFENPAIGAYMNEHYISIKVDRERRPDLDEQFMLVTEIVTGAGGWPNSVFLTSNAEPFFGGTYFPPDIFQDILSQVAVLWQNERVQIESEAAALSASVRQQLIRRVGARDFTPALAEAVAKRLLARLDPFSGGFGVAPKFPQVSSFLYLLDQAERHQNTEYLEAVTLTLDGMISGGIFDQVEGGFHRYAVDPEWQVPHFEKMLYSQAMIGQLLVQTARITGSEEYKRAAIRTFDFVLARMQNPEGGFYAALDADSLDAEGEMVEGAYYTWTPAQINAAAGEDAAYLMERLNVTETGNLDGATSVFLTDPLAPAEFSRFDTAIVQLAAARQDRSAPFIDQKIIVSWNAMMIKSLVEAAAGFDRPDYYEAAVKAARFILNDMQNDTGLQRISLDADAHVSAQLADYAGLGLALVALFDYDQDQFWIEQSQGLCVEILTRFATESRGFKMTATSDGLGDIIPMDDSQIPSGNALTLALFDALANRQNDPIFSQQAVLLAAAISGQALAVPEGRTASLAALQSLSEGAQSPTRYFAGGVVRVQTTTTDTTITLIIDVAEGWHINANQPLEDYFIPTEMLLEDQPVDSSTYPDARILTLAFNKDKPLALYENRIILSAPLPDALPSVAVLTFQACSEEICLAPVTTRFTLW